MKVRTNTKKFWIVSKSSCVTLKTSETISISSFWCPHQPYFQAGDGSILLLFGYVFFLFPCQLPGKLFHPPDDWQRQESLNDTYLSVNVCLFFGTYLVLRLHVGTRRATVNQTLVTGQCRLNSLLLKALWKQESKQTQSKLHILKFLTSQKKG